MEKNSNNNLEDSNIWLDKEIKKVFSIIEMMNLAKNLTSEKFTPATIKFISDELSKVGCHKSLEQVETVLVSLKLSYLKCKEALLQGIDNDLCPYYDSLDRIWNSNINLNLEKEKIDIDETTAEKYIAILQSPNEKIYETNSLWSDDETTELLNLIEEMNLTSNFLHKLSTSTVQKLVTLLRERGYVRTNNQVMGKIKRMRISYLRCSRAGSVLQDVNKCPFFDRINKMFQKSLTNDVSLLQPIDHDYKLTSETVTDTNLRKPNTSIPIWQAVQPFTDDERFYLELTPNDGIVQNCIKKKFENNTFEKIMADACHDNSTDIENFLDSGENSFVKCDTKEIKKNDCYSLRNYDSLSECKRKAKMQMTLMDIPKFIRVVKGKSKFILRKMETPYIRPLLSPHERFYSSIEKPSFRSIKPSPLYVGRPSSPVKITISKRMKHLSKPSVISSPIQLISTSSQTNAMNSDNLISDSIKTVLEQILDHQEQMQHQHHIWMEKQFELQRNYDRIQREALLKEIQELRKELCDTTQQCLNQNVF